MPLDLLVIRLARRLQQGFERVAALDREVAILNQRRLALAQAGLGEIGDVLRHHQDFDGFERTRIARCRRHPAEIRRGDALLKGPRQHQLRSDGKRRASPRLRREPLLFLDLRGDGVVPEGGRGRLDRHRREIPLDHGDLRAGGIRRARLGCPFQRLAGDELHRVEARHFGREDTRGHGQRRRDPDEGADLDDLALSETDRHRGAKRLLGGGDHQVTDEAVAFPREVGGIVAGGRPNDDLGMFRYCGEGNVALQRHVDRRSDQSGSGQPGQRACAEPTQVDVPPVDPRGIRDEQIEGSVGCPPRMRLARIGAARRSPDFEPPAPRMIPSQAYLFLSGGRPTLVRQGTAGNDLRRTISANGRHVEVEHVDIEAWRGELLCTHGITRGEGAGVRSGNLPATRQPTEAEGLL